MDLGTRVPRLHLRHILKGRRRRADRDFSIFSRAPPSHSHDWIGGRPPHQHKPIIPYPLQIRLARISRIRRRNSSRGPYTSDSPDDAVVDSFARPPVEAVDVEALSLCTVKFKYVTPLQKLQDQKTQGQKTITRLEQVRYSHLCPLHNKLLWHFQPPPQQPRASGGSDWP